MSRPLIEIIGDVLHELDSLEFDYDRNDPVYSSTAKAVIDAYKKHQADNGIVEIERGSVPEWMERVNAAERYRDFDEPPLYRLAPSLPKEPEQ